jgi:hypothetical protein
VGTAATVRQTAATASSRCKHLFSVAPLFISPGRNEHSLLANFNEHQLIAIQRQRQLIFIFAGHRH